MKIRKKIALELFILIIITVPAFVGLLNSGYFSMHDDQHMSRLYLLDQAIRQGSFYPRWVGGLGFNYGYPLFNFYPPLIYYVSECFHLVGFNMIWSIKMMVISGFFLSALGAYFFSKQIIGRRASWLAVVLQTYFFYHAILSYVRGALAEFFAFAILPFVFGSVIRLAKNSNTKNILFLGLALAFLVIAHPLIAFPAVFFLVFFLVFLFFSLKEKRWFFLSRFCLSGVLGLALSSFFWLPSFVERKYTLVDSILTKNLYDYKIHFVALQQFWYSPWGYGGSVKGLGDGLTFQLGKIHIALLFFSFVSSLIYLYQKKKVDDKLRNYFFVLFLLGFGLFMATDLSAFVWDKIKYLWYLQFPWRFLTFVGIFLPLAGAYTLLFFKEIVRIRIGEKSARRLTVILAISICLFTIFRYSRYFKPQTVIFVDERSLVSFEEISWRVSKTSFEFVPSGVETIKTGLDTVFIPVEKKSLPKKPYELVSGKAVISTVKDDFANKTFMIKAQTSFRFRLNTFYFPGWKAYIDDKPLVVKADGRLRLITVDIPQGEHNLKFVFEDTPVRLAGNIISLISVALLFWFFFTSKDSRPR
ncbi:hypothetical protein GYA28_02965 [Candidatus Roizmanbacteria bacterium]|nr:hypothetical protein [Candidatus Roizmanbacteria bacterium]